MRSATTCTRTTWRTRVLEEYLSYLRSVRALSPRSILAYSRDLGVFLSFLRDEEVADDEVTAATVRR